MNLPPLSRRSLSRRGLIRAAGATVAVSAATLAGASAPVSASGRASEAGDAASVTAGSGKPARGLLIPPGKIGIQQWSIRDAVAELGFRVVFAEMSRIGYRYFEFFDYTSPAEPGLTVPQLRTLLDDHGLRGIGAHRGLNAFRTNLQQELDQAEILGLPYIGTANEPVTPDNRTVAGYRAAAEEFNGFGAAARARGLQWYQHNHQNEFRFAADAPDVRLYDVLLAETDPDLVFFELDVFWAFVGQHIAPGFDPADFVRTNPHRFPLLHAKDGERREDLPNGFDFVEFGAGDIDFAEFYREVGRPGLRFSLWEQDNAPDTPDQLGGSLGAADRSYQAMRALRG